jgi:hypothetical protein
VNSKIFIFLSLINIPLLLALLFVYVKKEKTTKELLRTSIDNAVMKEYIDIINSQQKTVPDELVDNENFIKFLSDSRDWAFEYIENVQKEIESFVGAVDPDLEYFDKYGEVGSAYPHYDSMKRFSVAYKQLKSLLPKEINNEQ